MSSESIVPFKSKQKNPEIPGVDDIDAKELSEKLKEVVVVDVRRPDEWTDELGHIPGAIHMVLDSLADRIGELPDDRTLVFVCRAGGRSARATAYARAQGYLKVYNMRGGMMQWNNLGLPVEGRSED